MNRPISLVCLSASVPSMGREPGVTNRALMTDHAEDVGLTTVLVDGVAQRLAVNGQALVGERMLRIPRLQRLVEGVRVDADEYLAEQGATGHRIAPIAPAATKTPARGLAQVLGPFADGLVAARAAQHRGGGDGQHRRQGMASSLRATWIGYVGEQSRQGTHMLGTDHQFASSMAIARIEYGRAQAGLGAAHQRAHEHPFGLLCGGAVALAGAAKAAGIAHIGPVRCAVDGAVEVARIDKGLEQPQGVAKACVPIVRQSAFAQRQDARSEIAMMVLGQDQEARMVGNQMQAVVLEAKVPANPLIAGRALPGRGAEAQQRQPLLAPSRYIPQGVANFG